MNYWKLFHKLLDDNVCSDVIGLLAFWYSNQSSRIRWKSTLSISFSIGNGTRQGGILSPYLFTRYIRELIDEVAHCGVGCNIGGTSCNLLAYADDLVLLAPSWRALQHMIDLLSGCAIAIDLSCNVSKTVCMVFQPACKKKSIGREFPAFMLNGIALQFVTEFRYLGHLVNNKLSDDDDDINRELRNLFVRTNYFS